jgi:hypothetical protein
MGVSGCAAMGVVSIIFGMRHPNGNNIVILTVYLTFIPALGKAPIFPTGPAF